MWEGVTPVAAGYDPIVSESPGPAKVVVFNAGPGTVQLRAWDVRHPQHGSDADSDMELRPGATRAVWGALVRVALKDADDIPVGGDEPAAKFAAVGWRADTTGWWMT
jgi:hypothetical protein